MLNMQPNGEEIWGNTQFSAPDIQLTNLQSGILTISRSAVGTRTELAASAAQSRSTMLLYQWLIVITGAMTTILVSIKSMSNETNAHRGFFVIGVLAVIFSALGTALASINSFMGPNDAYVRSERALLQVRQLHMELAIEVAQEKDLCHGFDPDKSDDPRAKRLAGLATRLKDIVASSGFSSNVPSAAGSAGSSSTSPATTGP